VSEVFIDTAFLVALIRSKETLYPRASRLVTQLAARRTRMVTTDAVLIEYGNFFSRLPQRGEVVGWISRIRGNADWLVERLDGALLGRSEARYQKFHDKNWSMTDCISMEVMQARGISEIATTDKGFKQAGFSLLL
jgi:predicted nucleic acid-binding protein